MVERHERAGGVSRIGRQGRAPVRSRAGGGAGAPASLVVEGIGLADVRRLLDDLTASRLSAAFQIWDQSRYDALCQLERTLLDRSPPEDGDPVALP